MRKRAGKEIERVSDRAKDRTAHAVWNAVLETKRQGHPLACLCFYPDRKGGLILIAACKLGAEEGTDLISWS